MQRLDLPEVLALETRSRVLAAVRARPGLRVGTLARQLGLGDATVRRHVGLLRRWGLLEVAGDGQPRLFPSGVLQPREKLAVLAAATPAAARVLAHVREHGPTDLPGLRAALALQPSTISVAVQRLARAGVVETRRRHRRLVVAALAQVTCLAGDGVR
jgi:predicted transcriptional regulator